MGFIDSLSDIKESDIQVAKVRDKKPLSKFNLDVMNSGVRPLTDDFLLNQNQTRHRYTLNRFCYDNLNLYDLFRIYKFADILQIIFGSRARELVRNGFEKVPKVELASEGQEETVDNWLNCANDNNQTMSEILKELSKDLDWSDDAYLLCVKDYLLNAQNDYIGSNVKEFVRLNPLVVEMIFDKDQKLGYDPTTGKKVYFDPENRGMKTFDPVNVKTGVKNLEAHYQVRVAAEASNSSDNAESYMYYNKAEILHLSLYNPSLTYGHSPLFSLYPKVLILLTQDDYIRKFYGDDKPPKGFMVFNTDNSESLQKAMDDIRLKASRNPHQIFPLIMNTRDSTDPVKYIDMSRSLQEMQFTQGRNEYRNQIGAVYGVSPVFQNDTSQSGGLNNEGLQITITNRAIEDLQTLFNQKVLNFIFKKNLNITDWDVLLLPSEEQDEAHELDLEAKELANAKAKLAMGLKGSLDENGKFTFEAGELQPVDETPNSVFGPFEEDDGAPAQVDVTTPVDLGKAQSLETSSAKGHKHNWVKDMQYTDMVNDHHHEIDELNMVAKADPENGVDHEHKLLDEESFKPNDTKKVSKAKENPIPLQEGKKFTSAIQKEFDDILKDLNIKKKPTKKQMEAIVSKLSKNVERKVKASSANRVKAIYRKALNKVQREEGTKLRIEKKDRDMIESLKRSQPFQEAFANTSKDLSVRLNKTITEFYKRKDGFTIDQLTNALKEQSELSNSALRRIAKTETSRIAIAARKTSYQKTGKFDTFKFRVIGPNDNRTGKDSKSIVKDTEKGVSWDEMVKIIQKHAGKGWTVDKDSPMPRPNWRHVPVRIVE